MKRIDATDMLAVIRDADGHFFRGFDWRGRPVWEENIAYAKAFRSWSVRVRMMEPTTAVEIMERVRKHFPQSPRAQLPQWWVLEPAHCNQRDLMQPQSFWLQRLFVED